MPGFQNLFEPFASAWGTPLMLLQLGFTIWMLADANSRHVEYFWFWAILFFQPLGPWIYFVVVKLRQGSLRGRAGFNALPAFFEKKLSLKELQYRVERAPTMMNRLALAERLKEKQDYTTAIGLLRAALVQDDTYCPALYQLALCLMENQQPDEAIVALQKIIKKDRRWSDYQAWHTLMKIQESQGKAIESLHTCRELEKMSPSWDLKCQLANKLIDNQLAAEAVPLLTRALEDYNYSSFSDKLRNRTWANRAKEILKRCPAG